jgi:N-acetylglucosaminyldiphosphoundecaprenol N-acetyl-beta-D-mannosaminyltransferase
VNSEKINILGININAVNIQDVIDRVDEKIKKNEKGYITITGVHGIMESQRSNNVKSAYKNAWMVVPDGMPLVYIGRMQGSKKIRRCFGPELMSQILMHSVSKRYTHFLYGGKEGVVKELKQKLEEKYPGLRIVGTYTPPFRELDLRESKELIEMTKELKPDIFWIGLSTPKQEVFMQKYLQLIYTKIMLGVGAAFDYHTDQLKPAPRLLKALALEWFFRLLMEPKRLWKRYLINNPLFIANLVFQITGLRKFG